MTQSVAARRSLALFRRPASYTAGIGLPWFTTWASVRSPALEHTPVALGLLTIAIVASFCDLGAALCTVASLDVAFNFFLIFPSGIWSFGGMDVLRTVVLLLIGLAIVWFCRKRQATEKALRSTLTSLQEKTDALVRAQQANRSAAWIYHTADRSTHWFEGGADIFGSDLKTISAMGSPTGLVVPEDLPKVALAAEHTVRTGEPFHVEFRVTWPNGEVHWLEARGVPDPGDPGIWRGVTTDTTDRKHAEAVLVRSEKLAAVGRLSSTIAHEINNPLESVTNLLYLAVTDPNVGATAKRYLQQAELELSRLASIARHTLTFVRTPPPSGPADVAQVAASVIDIFRTRCESRGAGFHCSLEPGLRVDMPAGELQQVLSNLISNATDAVAGPGGRIEVSIEALEGRAVLRVRDNGMGIPDTNIERIFDPFFTTKDDTGTGIGLWVTKELVEKYGGRIRVESGELEQGFRTAFTVEFPLAGLSGAARPSELLADLHAGY